MKPSFKAVFFALFFTCTITLFSSCKSYPASIDANNVITSPDAEISCIEKDSYFIIKPENNIDSNWSPDNGIIFYPGGLVEYKSYLPLMEKFAKEGVMCILVKMPFDFAFLDFRAAGRFIKLYPEVENWYMAGHSLGGAMAASYVSRHPKDFKGLILLAAYSTHNISKKDVKVLSIYGSNDGVLNRKHYQKYLKNLPPVGQGLTEIIIDGGNHSQFACYGAQKHDYMPEITWQEQQSITAQEFTVWVKDGEK